MQDSFQRLKSFYSTPSLWKGKLLGMKQFYLNQLDFDYSEDEKSELLLPDIPHGTVLGKRAEYYFKFCVEQSTNYRCLISNLQIFKGKTTIGELDFIIQHIKSNKVYHIELVYKFYIYDPELSYKQRSDPEFELLNELVRYTGPNRRDHLLKKTTRLKKHQLPLLYHPETVTVLKDEHISIADVQQRVCFLAQIFIPRELWNHDFHYLNIQCIKGYYLTYSAFALRRRQAYSDPGKTGTENTFFLPHKHQWKMMPFTIENSSYSYREVIPLIEKSLSRGFAPMVWMRCKNRWEIFFVIAD